MQLMLYQCHRWGSRIYGRISASSPRTRRSTRCVRDIPWRPVDGWFIPPTTYAQGTIRTNLDPFNQYDDAALWNALRLSHLGVLLGRIMPFCVYSVEFGPH